MEADRMSAEFTGRVVLVTGGSRRPRPGVLLDTVTGPVCIPVGLHTDLEAWERSHKRLAALDARIIPSHDMRIFPAGSVQRLAG
jgi:glyoxylase-like metal-dependent hydrolase (beta-lactamase superfamily II)